METCDNSHWVDFARALDTELSDQFIGPISSRLDLQWDPDNREIWTFNHRWKILTSSIVYEKFYGDIDEGAWMPRRVWDRLTATPSQIAGDVIEAKFIV